MVVGQMLDADNVLGYSDQDSANVQLRRVQMKTQCRGEVNPASNAEGSSGDGLPGFLPPYSDVASRLHVRLVWAHRPDHDWWVPEEGFEYLLKVRSYLRYCKPDNEQAGTAHVCSRRCRDRVRSGLHDTQARHACSPSNSSTATRTPRSSRSSRMDLRYAYMEYGGDTVQIMQ